jgi:antitoxin PrlF
MSYQSRVTIKGQITIPKDVRDALGLAPGELAELVLNADGDYVLKHKKDEGDAAKRAAIRKQMATVAGSLKTGKATRELMRELRGDDAFL